MNKLSREQQGFGVVEVLLVVMVLLLVGSIGYYVWHNRTQKTPAQTTSQNSVSSKPTSAEAVKTVTLLSGVKSTAAPLMYSRDTASVIDDVVSFAQPSDWRDDADTTAAGCGVANCLGQTMIVPGDEDEQGATYPDYFVVTVSAFKTNKEAQAVFSENWQDSNAASSDAYSAFTTTDGVKGFKYDFEPTTPTAANGNTYVEHVAYGISNGSHAAILNVKYFNGSNGSFANKKKIDFGQYAATVEQIAKTLHLAN